MSRPGARAARRAAGALHTLVRHGWPLPCTVLGVAAGMLVLAAGGSARRVGPAWEVALRPQQQQVPRWAARCRFGGITLGHVVIGQSHQQLAWLRAHEQVHVRQYERWGPLFLLAYPLASAWALLRGQGAHAGNVFERQAVRLAAAPPPTEGV